MKINTEFDTKMYEVVAKNISKYRNMKNISIDKLSEYTDIDKDYLIELEQNHNIIISIYDLYKISVVLDVNINDFFN